MERAAARWVKMGAQAALVEGRPLEAPEVVDVP